MDENVIRIKVGMAVSYIHNSTREDVVEIDRAEWDAMTDEEREAELENMAAENVANYLDSWALVEED